MRTVSLAFALCLLTTTVAGAQAPSATPPPPPSVRTGDVAPDFPANYLAFAEKLGAPFNILSDARRDISKGYGVFDEQSVIARRTTFVIDRQGVVQKVFMAQEALDPAHALVTCALLKEVK